MFTPKLRRRKAKENLMNDVLYIVIGLGIFVITALAVLGFERV